MKAFQRIVLTFLIGAGLGAAIVLFTVPAAIEWYAQPGFATPVSCAEPVSRALSMLRLTVLSVGGGLGFLLASGLEIRRMMNKKKTPADPVPPGG
ncbi:MAG: hypothetical protein U1E65_30780 [Myxococcota bacterium]